MLTGKLKLQSNWLWVIRKISVEFLEPRLPSDATTQALRAIVSPPRLCDMPVRYDESVTHIESATDELKFCYRCFALRESVLRVTTALNSSSAFIHLRFRIAQRAAGSRFHKIERTSDQADTAAIVAAQLYGKRKAVANLPV